MMAVKEIRHPGQGANALRAGTSSHKRYLSVLLSIACLVCLLPSFAYSEAIPRTIIALYSKEIDGSLRENRIHFMAEMPLNHLGLKVEYHNIDEGLPDIADRPDIRGVLTWFQPGMVLKDPEEFLNWASEVVDKGKRYVIIESPGFYENTKGVATSNFTINRFLSKLGMRDENDWVDFTYDAKYTYKDTEIVEYERPYHILPPPYNRVSPIKENVKGHLIVDKEDEVDRDANLVITGPKGGYIADGFAIFFHLEYKENKTVEVRQWHINPFKFFRKAFATDDIPKPDATTIAGRRIYYSHIDGDGWNNLTLVDKYKKQRKLSSWVIMEDAIKTYPDLPVSTGPIAADIDKEWVGSDESIAIAKELLALPNVEAGTHTYSHPFFWGFFADENPDKERPFLRYYPYGSWLKQSVFDVFINLWYGSDIAKDDKVHAVEGVQDYGYQVPRAFANKRYSTEREVMGSIKKIEELLPQGKKVKVLMWSGNTLPYEKAIRLTREAGIQNINGGDTRFDREYDSIGWISPIGRQVGKERQIYASNSNENTYTDLWTGRYYGFRYLLRTIENTETPVRLKPFNVYYHMYSGERDASLGALLNNLNYAQTQKIAPITTSQFSAIADGFYHIDIVPIDENSWRIENRGELQTIRFDREIFRSVDIEKSQGIVGFRHYQGSLYVYLDASVEQPVITLKPYEKFYQVDETKHPYLIESRWPVWKVKQEKQKVSFKAKGFGDGEMIWAVPQSGWYQISVNNTKLIKAYTTNHRLHFILPMATDELQQITIEKLS